MGRGIVIMEISSHVNKLLSKKFVQDLINNNQFEKLYAYLPDKVSDISYIGELTQLLLAADVNPLDNLDYIPEKYLIKSKIANFKIPDNIKTIKFMAFAYCNDLKSIQFPAGLEVIGDGAFYNCKSLDNIIIPGNVKIIEQDAFRYCDSLKNVTIEKGVQEIGKNVFNACLHLQYITYTGTIKDLKKMNIDFSSLLNSINIKCIDGEIGL